MMLYVIVLNNFNWQRFCNSYDEAFEYIHQKLHKELKEDAFIKNLKTYNRNGKLFASYESVTAQEPRKDIYSMQEISLADALNWMTSDSKSLWVMQNIPVESSKAD